MTYHSQRGSTLIISLIILVLLMLLGVTAMTTSDMAYKLTGNLQFENNAINNAEAVVISTEEAIDAGTINYLDSDFFAPSSVTAASSGLYPIGAAINPLTMIWDNAHSVSVAPGRRIIQLMSTKNLQFGADLTTGGPSSAKCTTVNTYTISALGSSARGASNIVQSYYSVLTDC